MLTKISTTVATVAIAAATTSAYVAEALDKRDAVVDQDNSLADVAILSHVNKIVKPSLRVDDHDGDASLLVNHVKQQEVDEKPLKNHWRRRTKMLGKDGSSRNSLDLGILGKNQEQKHSFRRHNRRHQRGLEHYETTPTFDYFFQIYLQTADPTDMYLDGIFNYPDGSTQAFLTGFPLGIIANYDDIFFPWYYAGAESLTFRFFVPSGACDQVAGLDVFICQLAGFPSEEGPNTCVETLVQEEGVLAPDSNVDCVEGVSFTFEPASFTSVPSDMPTDMPSDMPSKSSKSKSKKSKSKKSKSPSSAPSIYVDYTTY